MEETVARVVQTALGGPAWEVRRPEHGWSDRSFVATSGGRRVFVKFGTPGPILRRVADLGAAPAVLAAGEHDGSPYAIQEYVEGPFPDHAWVVEHRDELAALLSRIHRDPALRTLLATPRRVAFQVAALPESRRLVEAAFGDRPGLRAAAEWLTAHQPALPDDELVPTHGDISPKNFLITPRGLIMIDWEDAALADPMRDLGPLLWWYFPPPAWPAVMNRYGTRLTPPLTVRVYWWAACISLDITAGLLERGYRDDAAGFLDDFLAAAAERPNPRPQYRGLSR
ncbi:MAG: phosphotransferase [Candidatus Rokuibacteriota bacterium]